MSYSQILRRLNRLIQSTINDALDTLSKGDKDELDDFDRELRGEKRASESAGSGQRGGTGSSAGQRQTGSSSQSRQGGGQQSASQEGRRKPGEKDDAYYYNVLGLTPSATEAEIKKAYRKLMSQYHPDRVATLGEDLQRAASEKAMTINEAYHIIERRRGFK
ncbi:MAG: DnaJ domain-containing protein [Bacteroidetes bacterium]|nr:DnaJ domain-containing protein [Bacteroidota bacterium]